MIQNFSWRLYGYIKWKFEADMLSPFEEEKHWNSIAAFWSSSENNSFFFKVKKVEEVVFHSSRRMHLWDDES